MNNGVSFKNMLICIILTILILIPLTLDYSEEIVRVDNYCNLSKLGDINIINPVKSDIPLYLDSTLNIKTDNKGSLKLGILHYDGSIIISEEISMYIEIINEIYKEQFLEYTIFCSVFIIVALVSILSCTTNIFTIREWLLVFMLIIFTLIPIFFKVSIISDKILSYYNKLLIS